MCKIYNTKKIILQTTKKNEEKNIYETRLHNKLE